MPIWYLQQLLPRFTLCLIFAVLASKFTNMDIFTASYSLVLKYLFSINVKDFLNKWELSVVAYTYNSSTQEAEDHW